MLTGLISCPAPLPKVLDLGQKLSYEEVWSLQHELQARLIEGRGEDTIIFCEHEETITINRHRGKENILLTAQELAERGIAVHEIDRGGDVTWHGPGQLVCYPIVDLRNKRRDVAWYIRSLEEVIIRSLAHFNISSHRVPGQSGVWTTSKSGDNSLILRKIASIGIRISRWCTLHGFSLNIEDCSGGFSLIVPCGLKNVGVTSMREESRDNTNAAELDLDHVKKLITHHFKECLVNFSYL